MNEDTGQNVNNHSTEAPAQKWLVNQDDIPDDLAPGRYCCRIDESSGLIGGPDFRVRFVTPPRPHVHGDCLVQIIKAECSRGNGQASQ